MMIIKGGGLGRVMMAFKGPDGLNQLGGINIGRGEHRINGPGPDTRQVYSNRGNSQPLACTIGDEAECISL